MVWGCLAAHGVGRFYLVESIMLKEQYVSILENHMYPSTMMLFPDQDFIFQEDNDPKHTARVTKQWFIDKGKLVDSMPRRCQAVINSNGYATMY